MARQETEVVIPTSCEGKMVSRPGSKLRLYYLGSSSALPLPVSTTRRLMTQAVIAGLDVDFTITLQHSHLIFFTSGKVAPSAKVRPYRVLTDRKSEGPLSKRGCALLLRPIHCLSLVRQKR